MDTRQVAAEYRLSQWAQKIQRRVESRQSIKEYCETMGVSRNTYFYWQRKVRRVACERVAESFEDTNTTGISVPHFTEVKLREEQVNTSLRGSEQGQLQVETGDVKITVDSAYPPEKLAALLREFLRPC